MMGAFSDLLAPANRANPANPSAKPVTDSPHSHDSQATAQKLTFVDSPDSHDSQAAAMGMRDYLHAIARIEGLPAPLVDSIDPQDLDACDGQSQQTLAAYLRALARRQRMAAANVPAGWTRPVACAVCGPVLLWADAPDTVTACPWCWHRKAGLTIPRSQQRNPTHD